MQVQSLGQEDPQKKEMATQSSILAWKSHGQRSLMDYSPWGHKKVRHNWVPKQQQNPGLGRRQSVSSRRNLLQLYNLAIFVQSVERLLSSLTSVLYGPWSKLCPNLRLYCSEYCIITHSTSIYWPLWHVPGTVLEIKNPEF